jgi:uncharacterized protein YukJ
LPIRYGVLKCRPLDRRPGGAGSTHYQILGDAAGTRFRVSINVKSQQHPSELLYFADNHFTHEMAQSLPDLPFGFTPLENKPGGMALDYIRGNLFYRKKMQPLAYHVPGEDNDANDILDRYVRRAMEVEDAELYAFGERWGPEPGLTDSIFGFSPGNGIHDIHKNQGNSGSHQSDDGVYQDGGLLFHFPAEQRWVALFLAFQSQSWHTDDRTGHSLEHTPVIEVRPGTPPIPAVGAVYIVGAVIQPGGSSGGQSVTLLNTTSHRIDINGWSLADKTKRKYKLRGFIGSGEFLRVPIQGDRELFREDGDLITLLNTHGYKVDGVAYNRKQVKPGRTLKF